MNEFTDKNEQAFLTRLLFNFDAGTASVLDLQLFYFSFVAIHCDI